ncbi:MAG: LCP family protein [Clostridia bacterium]|nr:LCP family protein [Clostridia bacterium]
MSKRRKKKKSGFLKKFLIVLFIAILCFGGWFTYATIKNGGGISGALATIAGHNEKTLKDLDNLEILVMGESGSDGYKLADTIMVASFCPKTKKASLLSIPRDTYVGTKEAKLATTSYLATYKINSVYRNGTKINDAVESINYVTGLNIKNYLIIDTDALIKLVDVIGGVTFNVPIDMKYDDPTQKLHINLKAGEQLIDGKKAEQLLRFRHNNDGTTYPAKYGVQDIGRMRTQREFIMATVNQLLKPENIFNMNKIITILLENVKTNLNFDTIKDYLPYVIGFDTTNLKTGVLPGESVYVNKAWIYQHDKEATKTMIDDLFVDISHVEEEVVGETL